MKISILTTPLLFALGAIAQQVRIISPQPNTSVVAGVPFNATITLAPTTSSVDVVAVVFGIKLINPLAPETPELGQTRLATVIAPQFPIPGPVGQEHVVTLTIPTDLVTPLNTTYNLTSGELYTLGALNTPSTFTSQVTLFVTSN